VLIPDKREFLISAASAAQFHVRVQSSLPPANGKVSDA